MMLSVVAGRYEAEAVSDAETALRRAGEVPFDVLVTDVKLPRLSGIDLIPAIRRIRPRIATVVISGHATVSMAVTAMKYGAVDFLTKPFTAEDLRQALQVAAARGAARTNTLIPGPREAMVAESKAMRAVIQQVDTVAPYDTSVLIAGETGTGKELIARRLHTGSPRARRAFVTLNCAAVPERLLEDELFGHVRGAYTGADEDRIGRFEQAQGGTLLLDDIDDLSLPLQAKLLRVLQQRAFEKLGASHPIKIDVRIVAATSANLDQRIAAGTFRADLYYRLNVIRIDVPPLRTRPTDIPRLAESFLRRVCIDSGLPLKEIAPEVLAGMMAYGWPGNVRQLRNAMERAATLSGETRQILPEHVPDELRLERQTPSDAAEASVPIDDILRDFERRLLMDAMERAGGNKLKAAQLLGIKRRTFTARLKRAAPK